MKDSHTHFYISGHLLSLENQYPYCYIGLNAIKHPGQYRWLDSNDTVRIPKNVRVEKVIIS